MQWYTRLMMIDRNLYLFISLITCDRSRYNDVMMIGYRLNITKYARPRSSGPANQACEVPFRSETEGGHISPY